MTLDPESLYRQLGRLIETMPDLSVHPTTKEAHLWLGRAFALVNEVNVIGDPGAFTQSVALMNRGAHRLAIDQITAIIYRAFGVAESKAPQGAGGAFIPVGNSFDAFAAVAKIMQSATSDVFVIDPYMDETALTEFGAAVPAGVTLRLMSDIATQKPTLAPAAAKWVAQHGANRPLLARLAPAKTLHDRAIFIDQTTAWTLTQSLKDFAKKSPAEIVRADDTAALKISAYESIWASATAIV